MRRFGTFLHPAQAQGFGGPATTVSGVVRWIVCVFALLSLLSSAAPAQTSDYALRFFGTGVGPPGQQDRILIPVDDNAPGNSSEPLDVGVGSFTIEWWMRGELADNQTANEMGDQELFDYSWIEGNIVLDRDVWCGTENSWGVSIAGGFVRFGIGAGDVVGGWSNTIEGNVPVLDGEWHHVAVVRDATAGTLAIVVDGVLDFQGTAHTLDLSYPDTGVPVTGDCDTGQLTQYGWYLVVAAEKHDAGSAYPSFTGFLDELRVWDTARSVPEIAAARFSDLPAQANLVGEYRFEEGSGTAVADTSGASSPNGNLVAGASGNGEWVSRAADPSNTAPLGTAALIFTDGFETGDLTGWS